MFGVLGSQMSFQIGFGVGGGRMVCWETSAMGADREFSGITRIPGIPRIKCLGLKRLAGRSEGLKLEEPVGRTDGKQHPFRPLG